MLIAHVKGSTGALEQKLNELAKIKGKVKIGFFSSATYPDGKSVAYIAYLNEYGGHNPARPFMKQTAEKNGKKWANGFFHSIQGNFNQSSVTHGLEAVGAVGVGDVKRTIQDWPDDNPPNQPATIRRKFLRSTYGKTTTDINPNKVLVDSGQMIASVNYEVEK